MWIVDTCVVLDILEADPTFGLSSAQCLELRLPEGLAISPVTMVELAPAFDGDLLEQKVFLDAAGISWDERWTMADTENAHTAWNTCIQAKRLTKTRKRPVADILIGAFALGRTGLITRNSDDFRPWFPALKILEP